MDVLFRAKNDSLESIRVNLSHVLLNLIYWVLVIIQCFNHYPGFKTSGKLKVIFYFHLLLIRSFNFNILEPQGAVQ